MKTTAKFLLLVAVLNLARYLLGWLPDGISCLFFVSLTAVYMNHFVDPVKPFYLYSMLDAIILFPIIALANGLLYPKFFKLDFS